MLIFWMKHQKMVLGTTALTVWVMSAAGCQAFREIDAPLVESIVALPLKECSDSS